MLLHNIIHIQFFLGLVDGVLNQIELHLLLNYVLLYFQHNEIYNYLLKQYSQTIEYC
jgi:hypothetical protein